MKKESQNDRNFIVKTRKKWENRQSNSLIKLDAIASDWGHPGQVQTTPQTRPTKFQRFGRPRASILQATARSILGQSARSGPKMAGREPKQPLKSRRTIPEGPTEAHLI